MLLAMTIVVVEVVPLIFQRIARRMCDLPPRSATSHQLRILRDLDIVRVRRAGKSQLYALNERAFGFCPPRTCQAWKSALEPGPEHAV